LKEEVLGVSGWSFADAEREGGGEGYDLIGKAEVMHVKGRHLLYTGNDELGPGAALQSQKPYLWMLYCSSLLVLFIGYPGEALRVRLRR
jgi:hypothetical protein